MIYRLTWDRATSHTYMPGTTFYHTNEGDTVFKHRLMSPGLVLIGWHLRGNYQANKVTPTLPLLKEATRYHLNFDGHSVPNNTVIFEVTFRDFYGDMIQQEFLTGEAPHFTVPNHYATYHINIINGGCREVYFRSLALQETTSEAGDPVKPSFAKKRQLKQAAQKFVLVEPTVHARKQMKQLEQISDADVIFLPVKAEDEHSLITMMAKEDARYSERILIAYGPLGNRLAYHVHRHMPDLDVWVTADGLAEDVRTVRESERGLHLYAPALVDERMLLCHEQIDFSTQLLNWPGWQEEGRHVVD